MKLRNIIMAGFLGLTMTCFMACNNNATTDESTDRTEQVAQDDACCPETHACEGECSHADCTGECAEKNCEGCAHDGTCCGKEECAKKACAGEGTCDKQCDKKCDKQCEHQCENK